MTDLRAPNCINRFYQEQRVQFLPSKPPKIVRLNRIFPFPCFISSTNDSLDLSELEELDRNVYLFISKFYQQVSLKTKESIWPMNWTEKGLAAPAHASQRTEGGPPVALMDWLFLGARFFLFPLACLRSAASLRSSLSIFLSVYLCLSLSLSLFLSLSLSLSLSSCLSYSLALYLDGVFFHTTTSAEICSPQAPPPASARLSIPAF